MNAKVLLRDHDGLRTIALATPSRVLTFRPASDGNEVITRDNRASPRCIVELLDPASADLGRSGYKTISHSVHGTLGLITIDNDVFLSVVSGAHQAATLRPGETVQKILAVEFYCLNRPDFDDLLSSDIGLLAYDEDGYEVEQKQRDHTLEHPCLALKKLLSGGSFYFSADFDLTTRIQERAEHSGSEDFDSFEKGYLWNSYMIKPLVDFRSRLSAQERKDLDSTRLLTSAIRGYANTIPIPTPYSLTETNRVGPPSTMTLISRLSCLRAGTRFNARGVDDDGNVANFVETETIFWSPSGVCFSYVQIRGSIPVFWEQTAGLQQKINITRSAQATQPAFDKHFENLETKYGAVHVVNLLSKEKPAEIELSNRYRKHIDYNSANREQTAGRHPDHLLIKNTEYDFHAETRGPGGYEAASMIRSHIIDSAEASGYCLTEIIEDSAKGDGGEALLRRSVMVLQQHGVFRTNCLDCLDRTNLVQTIISQVAVEAFLEHRGERMSAELLARHNSLWADNGDALSKIYAGTGALKSSFTRSGKMSLAGALADARKSAQRLYINNFADKGRQTTIDTLLGRLVGQTPVYLFDPINDFVTSELTRRASEYSSTTDVTIWCGTLNLNGRTNGLSSDLTPWLFPKPPSSNLAAHAPPADGFHDIFAVGFQEIVELSPGQIMSTNPTRRQAWEDAVKKTLNAHAVAHGAEKYVLLRGGQLVGASLSIFVRASLLSQVKNVEGALQKTGMSGMAGNKGAVAIRMDVSATSLCFVTAHLAAGFANYDERNRDYRTIASQLRFQHNRSIANHDNVVWLGDFNYRIGLPEGQVKAAIAAGDAAGLEHLYENDQLNLQMVAGLTFPHYAEARIAFPPTYKYDVGTDVYDSSDKARIPAWCDRVLRKGHGLRQTAYDHVPQLKFSDHRPVYAAFVCRVDVVDERRRDALSRELYAKRKEAMGPLIASGRPSIEYTDDEDDLLGLVGALPSASSDKRKWWLDNGMPVRSTVQAPSSNAVLNPARPSNPFSATEQPDWVTSALPRKAPCGPASRQVSGAASIASNTSKAANNRPTNDTGSGDAAPALPLRSAVGSVTRKPAPPIPKKKATLQSANGSPAAPERTNSSGLMDEDADDNGAGLSAWTPLQPSS